MQHNLKYYIAIRKRLRVLATRLLAHFKKKKSTRYARESWTPQSELSRWVKVLFKHVTTKSKCHVKQMSHCPSKQPAYQSHILFIPPKARLEGSAQTRLLIWHTTKSLDNDLCKVAMTAKFEGQWLSTLSTWVLTKWPRNGPWIPCQSPPGKGLVKDNNRYNTRRPGRVGQGHTCSGFRSQNACLISYRLLAVFFPLTPPDSRAFAKLWLIEIWTFWTWTFEHWTIMNLTTRLRVTIVSLVESRS